MAPLEVLLDEFRPGRTIFVPGASGEILALAEALAAAPERLADVELTACLVPGMNERDYAGLHPASRLRTFMLPAAMRPSFAAGRIDLLPGSYTGAAALLALAEFDVAVAHVAPPDADGSCSSGIASDFTSIAWRRARRRVLMVNPTMPRIRRTPSFRLTEADLVVEAASPLIVDQAGAPGAEASEIAARVATLIPDGAHVQAGIGGVPGALWPHLTGHRQLVLRSGMVTEGVRRLMEAGAFEAGADHVAGIAYGSLPFYDWLRDSDAVRFATTFETHGASALAGLDRFHAVNGALEVDLFGQVNVEWRGGKLSGGVGGSPDFARAAMASNGGRSIIALASTARGGSTSRIVPRLDSMAISLTRTDVDTIVTEHGIASLAGLGLQERAKALIAIAAPSHRDWLAATWLEASRTF